MRYQRFWFIALVALAIPVTGWSCEPILPLMQLLSGASAAGPLFLTRSLIWLAAAIVIKCAAFVIFERRLPWSQAVVFMLLANIISTIPGVLVAAFLGSMAGAVFALPLVFIMGAAVGRRLSSVNAFGQKWVSGGMATAGFIVFFVLSVITFALAEDALGSHSYVRYWILKFVFVTAAATIGMLMSAMLEECVIALLSNKSHGKISFFKSVIRANYVTLAIVLLVAALEMAPKRLHAPHFITAMLKAF